MACGPEVTPGPQCEEDSWEAMARCGAELDGDDLGLTLSAHHLLEGGDPEVDAACTIEDKMDRHYILDCEEAAARRKHVLLAYSDPVIDLGLEIGDGVHLRAFHNRN